jgi:hypothetical protein
LLAGFSLLALVGSLFLGLGIAVGMLNVVSVVYTHWSMRGRSSHVFLAAGLCCFSGALALRSLYPGWRYTLGLFVVIFVLESLPLAVAGVLEWTVRRAAERLEGADLEAQDLHGRDLRGARLSGANLRRANLRGADLRDADLTGADLCNADLTAAFLRGAALDGARFDGADLRETEIYRVYGYETARYSHETLWPVEMDRAAIPKV